MAAIPGPGFYGLEVLHHDADRAVRDTRPCGARAEAVSRVGKCDQQQQQQKALAGRLVELHRMAWQQADSRMNHGPRHIGDRARRKTVDEVADPREQEAERRRDGDRVEEQPTVDAAAPGEHYGGDRRAQQRAVARHSALMQREDFERMRREEGRAIQEHFTESRADEYADRHPHAKIEWPRPRRQQLLALLHPKQRHGAGDERRRIRERAPPDRHQAEMDGDRVDCNGKGHRVCAWKVRVSTNAPREFRR
ncbi:MAG: hypothetical protein IPI73_23635 [Betaproteobacteria bacterium]|nr:hypothetical protein [Betaproteobacteria bacterium]